MTNKQEATSSKVLRSLRLRPDTVNTLDEIRRDKAHQDKKDYSNNLFLAGIICSWLASYNHKPSERQDLILKEIIRSGEAEVYGTY